MARKLDDLKHLVLVCTGKDCRKAGADGLRREAKACLKEQGVFRKALVLKMKCAGQCEHAPVACHQPSNTWFQDSSPRRLRQKLIPLLTD